MSKKKTTPNPKEEGPSITDFAVAEDQLAHLREAAGVTDETHHNPLWRLIDRIFRIRERRVKQPVQKKDLPVAVFAGGLRRPPVLRQTVGDRRFVFAHLLDRFFLCHDHH